MRLFIFHRISGSLDARFLGTTEEVLGYYEGWREVDLPEGILWDIYTWWVAGRRDLTEVAEGALALERAWPHIDGVELLVHDKGMSWAVYYVDVDDLKSVVVREDLAEAARVAAERVQQAAEEEA